MCLVDYLPSHIDMCGIIVNNILSSHQFYIWPVPGSQIVEETRKEKAREKFPPINILSSSRSLNSAVPTVSEPGAGYSTSYFLV